MRFEELIKDVLSFALSEDEINSLITGKTLSLYRMAFTSKTIDKGKNYEMFEQLGDVSIGKFLVNYMYRRFPQLQTSEGVDIVAKLKIKYGSKEQLQSLGEELNFWTFIRASEVERNADKKKLLEDVFEAFIGCTEYVIDDYISALDKINNYGGVGYNVVYRILKYLFDEIDISLVYEDLVDAKSRLNELITFIRHENKDPIKYKDDLTNGKHHVQIIWYRKDGTVILGQAEAILKKTAEEQAAAKAIDVLKNKYELYKPPPNWFIKFNLINEG